MLTQPGEAVRLSTTEIARRTGTSEAAVTRLSQRIGYSGFRELQVNLAYSLRDETAVEDEEIEPGDSLQSIMEKTCYAHVQALQETERSVDLAALQQVVELLLSARRVELYAFGGNVPSAMDLARYLTKLGIPAVFRDDPYVQAMAVTNLGPGDVVIAVDHRGANADLWETIQLARARGAAIVVITSRLGSVLTRVADVAVCTANRETLFKGEPLSFRLTVLLLMDVLFIATAMRQGSQFDHYLQQANAALELKHRRPGGRAWQARLGGEES